MKNMKTRYRSMRRGISGKTFYCMDALMRKPTSLQTTDLDKAWQIVTARNQADGQLKELLATDHVTCV